ncbi:hypothetical protein SBFV2_gp48 [Sulfolobales Beppu filamentous virus 2]|uniref:Uncharacterized protein n=1 Tax=Sulfolobales Beppu filamentous virus 2 TaxID=2493123 RepID=A0A3S8NF02_9VIRU|nr:hypothetical protein HOU84_gp48 [Sulfolobales Beppu filamentous virus 2]AZI75815.1 hypothetical protein SBFV2_gp48 [Sulfolobales Beppu filamentous virus 2]
MKVRIKGIVRIKKGGIVVTEVENLINFNMVASILAKAFLNQVPSGSETPIVVMQTSGGLYEISVTYNNFVWTGQFTVNSVIQITQFQLYGAFNGVLYPLSTVQTSLTLEPGTYTLEWVWDVDDPVGVVRDILNFGFSNTFKSVSASAGTCTNLLGVDVFQNFVTLLFACFKTSTTTTYSTFAVTFDVTNTSNTTYAFSTSLNFSYSFKLIAPNSLIVPFTIELS